MSPENSPEEILKQLKERDKKKSGCGTAAIVAIGLVALLGVVLSIFAPPTEKRATDYTPQELDSMNRKYQKDMDAMDTKDAEDAEAAISDAEREEFEKIKIRLKAKAKRDWPDDYATQEFWLNQQYEDYHYMNGIPDDDRIKIKAARDWPLDFSTQKYWYNEQIEARERLNN